MKVTGWGNYLSIDSNIETPNTLQELKNVVLKSDKILAFGNNKSYGDSSLNEKSIDMKNLNKILYLDKKENTIRLEAGILLSDLIEVLVPYGYFPYVVPGTKNVTIGGCIASNIHGKNHHKFGSFIECVESIEIVLANGDLTYCDRNTKKDLFYSTFGGMGLTGVIYSTKLKLRKIKSTNIDVEYIKCKNLDEIVDKMTKTDKKYEYSVAWIDTTNKHSKGVLILGNHSKDNDLKVHTNNKINVPFFFPGFVLNKFSIKLFNKLFYFKHNSRTEKIHYEQFFFPLDKIGNWNKIYGKRGFIQYQFVIPLNKYNTMKEILNKISEYKKGSFLSVLKMFKDESNYLSFPKEGFTLALDIAMDEKTKKMIKELDEIVLKNDGRIYLTKDALMSKEMFWKTYDVNKFLKVKNKYDKNNKFISLQADRLKIIESDNK